MATLPLYPDSSSRNRPPVVASPGLPGGYTLRHEDMRSSLYKALDNSITWGAILELPAKMLSGDLEGWFQKYVYPVTERYLADRAHLRTGNRVGAVAPITVDAISAPLTFGYALRRRAFPAITTKLYEASFARFMNVLERVLRGELERAAAAGARWTARAGLASGVALVPAVGWVVRGSLIVLDAYLIGSLAKDVLFLRQELIEAIVKEYE